MARDAVRWQNLGFSEEEAVELAEVRSSAEAFTLGRELAVWEQWVKKLERGQRWVPEDLDAVVGVRSCIRARAL